MRYTYSDRIKSNLVEYEYFDGSKESFIYKNKTKEGPAKFTYTNGDVEEYFYVRGIKSGIIEFKNLNKEQNLKINNENIALAETPYEDLYKKIKNDFLVPNIPYRRVIYPLSNVKGPNDFFKLSYPIKLEIFFRRGDMIDKFILIIREGEFIEKKLTLQGK